MLRLCRFASPLRRRQAPPDPVSRLLLARIIDDLQILAMWRPFALTVVAALVRKLTQPLRDRIVGEQAGRS